MEARSLVGRAFFFFIRVCYSAVMTKIEQLTQTAATLSDEQIDGLIAHAAYLAGQPLFYSAPADVLASIARGLAQHARGDTRLQAKIDTASA